LIIALDYDRTYTRDPGLWNEFIAMAELMGHKVVCVTMRDNTEPIVPELTIQTYYTARAAKGRHLIMAGIEPDIWIDDDPLSIFQGKQS